MLKVALSANTSWYLLNFRESTIRKLLDQGHEVYILAPEDEYSIKLKNLGCIFIDIPFKRGINPFSDILTLCKILFNLKKYAIECILNFTPKSNIYCSLVARLMGISTINNISGLGLIFSSNRILKGLITFLYRISQKKAKMVFFQNNHDRDLFLKEGIVSQKNSKRIYGSGVDLERFKVYDNPNDGVIKFLFMSRLLKDKGILEYIAAAKIIKKDFEELVNFSILGFIDDSPGSLNEQDVKAIEDTDEIIFLGKSDRTEEHIKNCDCIVLPTYYNEGLPKTLLEACAMGKPIISTSLNGNDVVVDGVNGLICKEKSIDDLVEKLHMFITAGEKTRQSMSNQSRKRAEQLFDEKNVLKEYINEIEKLKSK